MPLADHTTLGLCCPFREDSEEEGILCFDPWLDEYAKPPENIIRGWCNGDYLKCPVYTAFQRMMASRIEEARVD
ncbi:MAG: hypothetical protein A3J27_14215 [Candidatus Tectomicrobia bacterium RIFCSPLOWO2_12_FULL_69_37]|nr:MAG: hypothetical protein A3I72_14040 [Candidatus Tectomicrobia bacterium RIFCSPLOWO2_02_FULL_70_19]OGL65503.1 MAG: hypothetical protein A3J27_14215 [Candidatus Tectomicrobia bacterium RIFCSPLOWO2_12_FULL_69_37]